MTNSQIDSINKFISHFFPNIVSALHKALGKDPFQKFNLTAEGNELLPSDLSDYSAFAIYSRQYKKAKTICSFAVLFPENLAVKIADVFMGGNGDAEKKGALTELQVNSCLKFLDNILEAVAVRYNKICEAPMSPLKELEFRQCADKKHDDWFKDLTPDFVIHLNLKINDSLEFPIHLFLEYEQLIATMSRLGLLKEDIQHLRPDISHMNINLLGDIEIPLVAELGRTQIPIKYAMELTQGSLIELDNDADEPIKLYSEGVEVGTAEIVVVGDTFGVKIKKIIPPEERFR
ncbi:MAG: FliM/FliN family flagellar motor switch protein [Candidatus Gastranaerophilales bacterium]|nr:FliM/FliN family flagellar motor switch protein [Candidatus Gastranaerophilales bacterium]